MKKWNQKWTVPVKALLAGTGIAVSAILVPLVVSAVAPPANSVIGNQATANYFDVSGKPQQTLSNQVNTTVAQVGDFTLLNDGIKTASAGATVYIPHTLTNTGNGSDSFKITVADKLVSSRQFDSIAVYADTSGSGNPSGTPLCASPTQGVAPLCTDGLIQVVAGNRGVFNFVVAYTVPATANGNLTPFDKADVTVVPVPSSPSIPYTTTTATRTDTVNLTTGAAFTSTKQIGKPAVSAPSNLLAGNWPTAVTGGKASDASCLATVAGVNAQDAKCVYTVFTIGYQNSGGATGSFSMIDALPAGLTYVPGTAVWSGNSGIAINDSGTAGNTGSSPNVISSFFSTADTTLHATVSNVAPNSSGTISFVVLVSNNAVAGTVNTNTTNVAKYTTTDCDAACASTTTPKEPTNPSTFPVTPTYSVIAANIGTATTFDKDNSTTPPLPNKSGVDLVNVPSAFLGARVAFTDWVINKSNIEETFNLTIDPSNNNFPVGTSFVFYAANGTTTLLDTNGDGTPDTGKLAIGGSVQITVVATLPNTATSLTGPFNALMTATSSGDKTVKDSVWEQIGTLKSAKVDLTNTPDGNRTILNGVISSTQNCSAGVNCDLGQGPSPQPTDTETAQPGKPATFPIFITNEDTSTGSATYNLSASLPNGWTVKFVDGSTAGASCTDAAITTIAVPSGSNGPSSTPGANEKKVLACVTPPAGTNPGTTPVSIKAEKVGDASISDTITDAVTVAKAITPLMQLSPPSSINSVPNGGGTVLQPATLTNTGNTSCGQGPGFNVSLTFDSAAAAANWKAAVYFDANGNGVIDNGEQTIDLTVSSGTANLTNSTPVANNSLVPLLPAPGNTAGLPLLVKIFSPSTAVIGSSAVATLKVTDLGTTAGENCGVQTSNFNTTVTNGQLRVVKKQFKDSSCTSTSPVFGLASLSVLPGECILYQVVTTNEGNAPVTNVSLEDYVQQYTDFTTAQPTVQCATTGATGSAVGFTSAGSPLKLTCSGATPGVTLNPTGTMTMVYRVQVQHN